MLPIGIKYGNNLMTFSSSFVLALFLPLKEQDLLEEPSVVDSNKLWFELEP